jgi:uncharacterized OB-fold protein
MTHPATLSIVPAKGRRSYPPRISSFTQPFWDGLRTGHWQTTRCEHCSRQTFPPKPVCPHCWSTRVAWSELSARGTLYSWTRIHSAPTAFADEAPYAVGIVDLDSGIRLACRLHEGERVAWQPGMAVEMTVLQFEDGPLFAARPLNPTA